MMEDAPVPPSSTIFCLYCRATIAFPGLPANRYLQHLFAEHNIMHEVQSVINRTLALQLPKEYPELVDGSALPDSSTRLTSPCPSSEDPSPLPLQDRQRHMQDCSTQTIPVQAKPIACQTEFVDHYLFTDNDDSKENMKYEEEDYEMVDGDLSAASREKKRGCPKGGWPNRKKKKKGTIVSTQGNIRKMIERCIANKKEKFQCELCAMPFKKIYKLKLHLMKEHTEELSMGSMLRLESKQGELEDKEEKPERKSSRIGQKEKEGDDPMVMTQFNGERAAPAHLIRTEAESWTEGSEYFCMLCSQSFKAFGIYKHHIGDTHGLLIEDYRAKFGRVGEVINKYNCKICQEDIIHKFTNIKMHLKSIHDTTVAEYTRTYHQPKKVIEQEEVGEKQKGEETIMKIQMENAVEPILVTKLPSMEKMITDDIVEDEVSEPGSEIEIGKKRWYEGCSYTCLACNKPYDIYFSYHGHIKKIHNMSMEQYHTQYGQEGEVNRYYACKICHTNVVWRLFNIRKHMESAHELTLDQYGACYEAQVPEQRTPKVVSKEPIRKEEEKPWYEGPDHYQCLICSAKITHKFNNIASHMTLIHDLTLAEYEKEFVESQKLAAKFVSPTTEIDEEMEEDFDEEEMEEEYNFTEADIIIDNPAPEDDEDSIDDAEEGHLVINEDPVTAEGESHAWYHGSNLTCQICHKVFANDQWYFHHFSKIHGITKEKYNEQYGKELELWTQYQCLICGSKIRWKYSSIRQHLKQVHGTTIQDYEARYMDGTSEEEDKQAVQPLPAVPDKVQTPIQEQAPLMTLPSPLPPPPPLKAAPGALMARRVAEEEIESSPAPPSPPSLSSKGSITFDSRPHSQWYHGSDLTCQICHKSFVDFTYYCTHIRTIHQISKEQYNDKYGTASEKFRLYRCLVCGISVKWTYQSICGHLKSHEISIKDYENKYTVTDNQCLDSGKISDLTMNANVVLEPGLPELKKMQHGDDTGPPPLVAHQFLLSQLEAKLRSVPHHKPERIQADVSSPTGKWYNQCKFTCKACPEEKYFTVPQALRMHLNGIHSMSRKDYEVRYGSAETITRYWTCLICNKELKCQKGIIIQHLLNVHAMELVDYERQYMDAGDQVVARETKRPRKNRILNKMNIQQAINNSMNISMNMNISRGETNESSTDPSDLTQFLVQRMDEGASSIKVEGPVVTGELAGQQREELTSVSRLEVEGMDQVPWYFGCRYSCQICQKVWHYPQAARYHLDSVHKLTRAAYEAQYGTCEVETRIFHCSICQRSMKCERDIIKYHLEAKHSMSLEEYVEQCPTPVVTVGESRRSNAAAHARSAVPSLPLLHRFPVSAPTTTLPSTTSLTPTKVDLGQDKGAPWYRGSNFTCIPCQRQFTAQVSYISHINSKHGLNLREYRDQYGSVEEIRQYQCKIAGCSRLVSWTYSGINDHLKSHNMTMTEYETQYLGIGVGGVGGTRSEVTTPHELDEDPPGLEPEDFSTVVENWSNGYHRDCAMCGKQVVGGRKAFAAHILERHQVTLTEYANQHGDKEDRADSHTCHLCNELVQHDYEVLKGHVEKHGINIEHYYHKFIVSTNSDATNAEIIISKVSLGVSPPSSKAPVSGPVPIKVRKNHWANGCSYQCILCKGQKYPEEFMFKKHILTAHNMSTEEYQNNFGDPALVKQLHICKVCNKDIKHEYTAILNHLRVKHNMTLTEYSHNYMRTPGSMGLPPTTSSPSSHTNLNFHTASETGSNSEESGEFYIVYPELEQK